jgi:hypothetical protein
MVGPVGVGVDDELWIVLVRVLSVVDKTGVVVVVSVVEMAEVTEDVEFEVLVDDESMVDVIDVVDAEVDVEEPLFGENMYSCRPFGPPQKVFGSPAHFILHRPSVARILPVPSTSPQ